MTRNEIVEKILTSPGFRDFMATYKVGVSVFLSISTLAIIGMIIFNVTKLSKSGGNSRERAEAVDGLFVCLALLAFAGAVDIVFLVLVGIAQGLVTV